MLVDIIKKYFTILINMITEDNLATAQIAQLFGSELLKVQQNATTDSGAQPDIVKINPKQFLVNTPQFQSQKRAEEQRLIQMLQREAEAACPLPEQPQQALPQQTVTPIAAPKHVPQVQQITPIVATNGDSWVRIANSLERIANKLEGVDLTIKKKRVKRTTK